MNFKNYNFGTTKVTAVLQDGNFLWIAFQGVSGETKLRKVSAFDLDLIYFDLTVPVDKITNMVVNGALLYASLEDDTYIMARYGTTSPFVSYTYVSKPVGITQNAKDIAIVGSDIFLLLPGENSGENAKLVKYTGITYQETIDLTKTGEVISNVSSMASDGTNLWLVTYESPSKLVKVYEASGGIYDFESWTIL